LRSNPAGLWLIDAACELIDPNQVSALRRDVGLYPAHAELSVIRKDAANAMLGALLNDEAICELHWLGSEPDATSAAATLAAVHRWHFGEISVTGPVARLLSAIKQELTGDPALLEAKFEVRQLLAWRTRG
jgi:hypothetical protein